MTLPPFPTDETTLDLILESFQGAYAVDLDGTHHWTGSDFSFHRLLDFYAGYDPNKLVPFEGEDMHTRDDILEYKGDLYGERDVVKALIAEIRRLRKACGEEES